MHLLYCFLLQVLVKLMLNIMVSETVPVYWELGLVLVPENEDGLIICMIGCWRAVAGNCGFLPGYSHNFMLSNWKTITLGNHQCSLNAMQISQIYLFLYMWYICMYLFIYVKQINFPTNKYYQQNLSTIPLKKMVLLL